MVLREEVGQMINSQRIFPNQEHNLINLMHALQMIIYHTNMVWHSFARHNYKMQYNIHLSSNHLVATKNHNTQQCIQTESRFHTYKHTRIPHICKQTLMEYLLVTKIIIISSLKISSRQAFTLS